MNKEQKALPLRLAHFYAGRFHLGGGAWGEARLDFDSTGFLLAFSEVVTILPLLTFNSAAKYLRLSTLGFFSI